MSSSRSSSSGSSISSTPSFLAHLDLSKLATAAAQVRGAGATCSVGTVPHIGASNVVYGIEFDDGIQWAARIPIEPWSKSLEEHMMIDRISLDFIGSRTSIPVPRIIEIQPTEDNVLGRPYTLTTFLPGTSLAKLWFDAAWFTDERRNHFFRSLAGLMVQLSAYPFSAIGQLDIDPQTHEHFIRPFVESTDISTSEHDEDSPSSQDGPYYSTHVYLLTMIADQLSSATNTGAISDLQLLRSFAGMIPDPAFDGAPFYLCHPDLGYQNILVDADGNVTGIVDWDNASTRPRQCSFACYPSWITRDWDPAMYSYRETPGDADIATVQRLTREEQQEDSPERLEFFRAEYLAAITSLNPNFAELTRYSHLLEAIEIATSQPFLRGAIIHKFTEYVYGENTEEVEGFLTFATLARRLSMGRWTRELVGEERLLKGGKYN